AFDIDVSLVHMNRADAVGNGQFLGPDLYFDDLFAMAAKRTFMSCERVVATEDLLKEGSVHTLKIPRLHTDGVVEAPGGAHFTECPPDYSRDETFQREYAATARDPDAWTRFRTDWLDLASHDAYRARLAEREHKTAEADR
ncbi:MAG: acyl CoA--acetate/3-ketoacid CoA transferase subunit alpha, partial [Acidimicrobiaceae bacterium]|nr:acyl CoA--acetate/3-ketoacid CoA transferase subunit alpha [Acidimicrobiaceae bacterium]